MTKPPICVIGAGRIGLPVAANFVAAGYLVTVFDVRAELAGDVERIGARWAGDSRDAVKGAGVLVTVLPGSPELARLMLGSAGAEVPEFGLLDVLDRATTWIDLTSAAPVLAAELAQVARERGVAYLDAPIGGGPAAARAGDLTFYVGGDPEVFQRCQPMLTAIGGPDRIHHVGRSGSGYLVKLLINSLWFTQVVSLTEAALLAQAGGIDPGRLDALLAASPAGSAVVADYLPRLRRSDYVADFGLDRVVEELTSLGALADLLGSPFDLGRETARLHREALASFGVVDGELLAAAYLEHRAGRRLSD